jgi:hypothetical protein
VGQFGLVGTAGLSINCWVSEFMRSSGSRKSWLDNSKERNLHGDAFRIHFRMLVFHNSQHTLI